MKAKNKNQYTYSGSLVYLTEQENEISTIFQNSFDNICLIEQLWTLESQTGVQTYPNFSTSIKPVALAETGYLYTWFSSFFNYEDNGVW